MNRYTASDSELRYLTGYVPLPLLLYSINISLKFNYIYFETPKAACSTIKRFLIRNESRDIELGPLEGQSHDEFAQFHDREFSPLLNPRQVYPFAEKLKSGKYFRFCFVRNPYSRILSVYLDQIAGRYASAETICKQLGIPPIPLNAITFEVFIDAICAQMVTAMDAHWKPQYFHTCQNVVDYDFVGRFESFDSGIEQVARSVGLDLSLLERYAPHRTRSSERLGEFYTQALKRKVYGKFEVDFVRFGYPQ